MTWDQVFLFIGIPGITIILVFFAYQYGKAIGHIETVERLNARTGKRVLEIEEQVRRNQAKLAEIRQRAERLWR